MPKAKFCKRTLSEKEYKKKALEKTLAEFEELAEYENNLASYEEWIKSKKQLVPKRKQK